MLFSNESVANFINENFEPVWVSVRPVPIVTLDFGNDNILTRTLHGNVATYACTADGYVIDVLPGIYQAEAYLEQLAKLRDLQQSMASSADPDNAKLEKALRSYHQLARIKLVAGVSSRDASPRISGLETALAADTMMNESIRRAAIHEYLAKNGLVHPSDIRNWLYREILHADLDDPWLGLGDALFANYPFAGEDAVGIGR